MGAFRSGSWLHPNANLMKNSGFWFDNEARQRDSAILIFGSTGHLVKAQALLVAAWQHLAYALNPSASERGGGR